jgi:hypothetical protein
MAERSEDEPKEPQSEVSKTQAALLSAMVVRINELMGPSVMHDDAKQAGITNIPTPEQDLKDLITNLETLKDNMVKTVVQLNQGEISELPPDPVQPGVPNISNFDYLKK